MTEIKIKASDNFLANTAAIVAETLSAPLTTSVLTFQGHAPKVTVEKAPGHGAAGRAGLLHMQTRDAAPAKAPKRTNLVIGTHFKLVFLTVVVLTVAAAVAGWIMASSWVSPTDMQKSAYDTMNTVVKLGFGAIVGLIGGKNLR